MKVESILPIATFLARTWSDEPKLEIKLERNTIPRCYKDKRLVIVGLPEDYKCSLPIHNYRLWRVSLWHESMHMKHSPLLHGYNTVIHQAIEDYRIEHIGIREYPGMKNEKEFANAMHYYVISPAKTNVDAFIQKLLLGTVKLDDEISKDVDMAKVDEAVNYTITELEKHGYCNDPEVVRNIAKEVAKILGADLNDYTTRIPTKSQPHNINFGSQKIKQEDVKDAVKQYVSKINNKINNKSNVSKNEPKNEEAEKGNEKGRGNEDAKTSNDKIPNGKSSNEGIMVSDSIGDSNIEAKVQQLLKPSEDVEKEFTVLKQIEKQEEKRDMEGVHIPRRLHVEEHYLYNQQLIKHLIAVFSKLRKGWMEYPSTHGEFDVENYITGSKPFIDEKRMKRKAIKVILLLDLSKSIDNHNPYKYKTVCVSIAEALNKLGIKFAVYAFNTTAKCRPTWDAEIILWQIKGERELWSKMNVRRLAQVQAQGATPMKEIYERLEKLITIGNNEKIIMFTITDGEPTDAYGHSTPTIMRETAKVIQRLKKHCKMYAIAIGKTMYDAVKLANNLKELGYDKHVATDDLKQLPMKVLKMIQEEVMGE